MEVVIGRRLYHWDGPGKAGVVKDTRFIRCFWPHLKEPTRIFAPGSSGLIVQGPPTPRNVVFPDDTVFPDVSTDAENVAWAAFKATPGRGFSSNAPGDVAAYLQAYEAEQLALPPTATKMRCRDDCHCLVHDQLVGHTATGKPILERYVAEITKQEALDLCDGKVSRAALEQTKDYCRITDNPQKQSTPLFRLDRGAIRNKTAQDVGGRSK